MLENLNATLWSADEVTRPITKREWDELWRHVEAEHVPVSVVESDFGFAFGLVFYRTSEFPSVEDNTPALRLVWDHFKALVPGLDRVVAYDARFDLLWGFCSGHVLTDRNQERLRVCGLPKVRSADYYRY